MPSKTISSFVARQTIVDINTEIVGYELLFRDGWRNAFPNVSSDQATSQLIVDSLLDNSINKLVGHHKAFINFSERTLIESFPDALDKDKIVIEILETVKPQENVIEACQQLKEKGYTMALDDYDFNDQWRPYADLIDIIKIDISVCARDELARDLRTVRGYNATLLAERVENYDDFKFCKDLGFDLFQGYFFAKPEVIEHKKLSSSHATMLQLMAETAKSPMDFDKLNNIIARDVGISFKLLKFINSSALGISREITSLNQAVILLGEKELRKFVSLVAMAKLSDGKSTALMSLAVLRARFCEQLMEQTGNHSLASSAFLTGMLSLIEAVLDDSLDNIFAELPLDSSIKDSIRGNNGVQAAALDIVKALERCDWNAVECQSNALGISDEALAELYSDAVEWTNSFENG